MLLEGGQGALALRILGVTLEVYEEDVLRLGGARWERLNPRQVDLVLLEDVQGVGQRARGMGDLEHECGLVLARSRRLLQADDGKARLVKRVILDVGREDAQSVAHRRLPAGDRGRAR